MEPKEYDFEFTRGDTCPLKFFIKDKDGNILNLSGSDNLLFTVKNSFNASNIIFQKTFQGNEIIQEEDGSYKLIIEPTDTENMNYGSYVFDICLTSGDYVRTIVIGHMTLTNEVTF